MPDQDLKTRFAATSSSYQDMMDDNAEKFRLWGDKCTLERKQAFGKIIMYDGFRRDSLSYFVAAEMELLLAKSGAK